MKKHQVAPPRWRGLLVTAAAFLGMILVLVFALSQVHERSGDEQTKILQDAVLRATLTCYAVEGRYPQSIGYLKTHYGIVYDEDKYIVTLDAFASNLLPTINVMSQGGVAHEQ